MPLKLFCNYKRYFPENYDFKKYKDFLEYRISYQRELANIKNLIIE